MAKKALIVITKSNFGGAQRYVYDLATHLPEGRFDVAVAFGMAPDAKPGRLSNLLQEKDIHTIEIPELARDMRFGNDWRAFRDLTGLFVAEKPDIVHLNSSKAGGLGALAARLAGVRRIVFTIHGLPSDEKRPFLARAPIAFATWLTMMLAHATIAISNDIFERVRRYPFAYRRVHLVYNGIDAIDFSPPQEARKALRSIDPAIPEHGFLAGTIAELHPNKDLACAIEAVGRTPEAHLCIIGEGELREKLRLHARDKGVEGRVHFLGFVPDAAKYLRAFDVFLLTSVKEGLPYVLLEAGQAHVPVVATDIPGVREIVLHNFTGLLAPMRSPEKFADCIRILRDDSALVKSLTEEMATRILKTFSLQKMIEKTANLY